MYSEPPVFLQNVFLLLSLEVLISPSDARVTLMTALIFVAHPRIHYLKELAIHNNMKQHIPSLSSKDH